MKIVEVVRKAKDFGDMGKMFYVSWSSLHNSTINAH